MNREKAIRTSFFNSLNGALSYEGYGNIPIFDGKVEGSPKLYVLLEDQNASDTSDMRTRAWSCTFSMSITYRQDDSYTKDIIDNVCELLENIIMPGFANQNGLQEITGWHITNVRLSTVSYANFKISQTETVSIKYLTFNLSISKI